MMRTLTPSFSSSPSRGSEYRNTRLHLATEAAERRNRREVRIAARPPARAACHCAPLVHHGRDARGVVAPASGGVRPPSGSVHVRPLPREPTDGRARSVQRFLNTEPSSGSRFATAVSRSRSLSSSLTATSHSVQSITSVPPPVSKRGLPIRIRYVPPDWTGKDTSDRLPFAPHASSLQARKGPGQSPSS